MIRYDDIDPMDIDPETNRPYANYSSPALDNSFHDGEMAGEDDYLLSDWQYQVANGDTKLGFKEWVAVSVMRDRAEREHERRSLGGES